MSAQASSPTKGAPLVNSEKYIGLDVHQATISVAVMDSMGKLIMESILETKAATGEGMTSSPEMSSLPARTPCRRRLSTSSTKDSPQLARQVHGPVLLALGVD